MMVGQQLELEQCSAAGELTGMHQIAAVPVQSARQMCYSLQYFDVLNALTSMECRRVVSEPGRRRQQHVSPGLPRASGSWKGWAVPGKVLILRARPHGCQCPLLYQMWPAGALPVARLSRLQSNGPPQLPVGGLFMAGRAAGQKALGHGDAHLECQ